MISLCFEVGFEQLTDLRDISYDIEEDKRHLFNYPEVFISFRSQENPGMTPVRTPVSQRGNSQGVRNT